MATERFKTLEQLEIDHIKAVLVAMAGNMSRAARTLGIDRRTLYRKVDAWNIRPPTPRQMQARIERLEAELAQR